jgi:hypothetical protein
VQRFLESLLQTFSSVDMKGKDYKKTFNDVQNEFRVISARDDVFNKWKRVIEDFESGSLICPENGVPFKTLIGWNNNDGLTHEFFKTLSALSTDEMDDLANYILNERKTSIGELKDLPKVTIRNLSPKLKGRGIFATEEWAQRKQNKNIIVQTVDHVSDLKYKLTYEDDCTLVVRLVNWKLFKKDFRVSSATMSLWMAIVGPDFLKGKLARKKKKKEPPAELVTQILHVLEHRSSVLVEDRPVQFCTIDRQKFHKFQ